MEAACASRAARRSTEFSVDGAVWIKWQLHADLPDSPLLAVSCLNCSVRGAALNACKVCVVMRPARINDGRFLRMRRLDGLRGILDAPIPENLRGQNQYPFKNSTRRLWEQGWHSGELLSCFGMFHSVSARHDELRSHVLQGDEKLCNPSIATAAQRY